MKQYLSLMILLLVGSSCVSNPLDATQDEQYKKHSPLSALLTKSGMPAQPEDSLTIMNKHQKDIDNLMMNRIIFKDSIYILAIKRQDAIFLGVSETVYDKYVEYVAELNVTVSNE